MLCVTIGALALVAFLVVVLLAWLAGAGLTALGVFLFAYRYVRTMQREGYPVGFRQLPWLALLELRASLLLTWWHLRAQFEPTFYEPAEVRGAPVLLVHGYTQNSTNLWGIQRALAAVGHPSERVFLGISWPWRRVEDYAGGVEAALEEQRQPVGVIAHSLGGVVLREVLARRPDLRERVYAVVTLGSPHRGTAVHPRLLNLLPFAGQLALDAPWLQHLPALPELLPGKRVTTVGSVADMIVYPEWTTHQPGAHHVRFEEVGHGGLLTDRSVIAAAVAGVAEPVEGGAGSDYLQRLEAM